MRIDKRLSKSRFFRRLFSAAAASASSSCRSRMARRASRARTHSEFKTKCRLATSPYVWTVPFGCTRSFLSTPSVDGELLQTPLERTAESVAVIKKQRVLLAHISHAVETNRGAWLHAAPGRLLGEESLADGYASHTPRSIAALCSRSFSD